MKLKEIKKQIREFEALAEKDEALELSNANQKLPPASEFKRFWPLLKIALTLIKVVTGPKGDAAIDRMIAWGDSLHLIVGRPGL